MLRPLSGRRRVGLLPTRGRRRCGGRLGARWGQCAGSICGGDLGSTAGRPGSIWGPSAGGDLGSSWGSIWGRLGVVLLLVWGQPASMYAPGRGRHRALRQAEAGRGGAGVPPRPRRGVRGHPGQRHEPARLRGPPAARPRLRRSRARARAAPASRAPRERGALVASARAPPRSPRARGGPGAAGDRGASACGGVQRQRSNSARRARAPATAPGKYATAPSERPSTASPGRREGRRRKSGPRRQALGRGLQDGRLAGFASGKSSQSPALGGLVGLRRPGAPRISKC